MPDKLISSMKINKYIKYLAEFIRYFIKEIISYIKLIIKYVYS